MNPSSSKNPHNWTDPRIPDRKGSVRRAREMLEAGRRPKIRVPQADQAVPPSGARLPQTNGWPLPGTDSLQANKVNPQGRLSSMIDEQGNLLAPQGILPQRPPQHSLPSPSIYSRGSISDSAPSPLRMNNPASSFSQPFANQSHIHPALREPAPVTSEDMSRKSAASSMGSIPSIPDFPPPLPPQNQTSNLAPAPMRPTINGRFSVSPIPEELPDSPTILDTSIAPSDRSAASWNSEQRESGTLGAYIDDDSDSARDFTILAEHSEATPVRQASLGKRGRPSLRTISKPNMEAPQLVEGKGRTVAPSKQCNGAALKEIAAGLHSRASFDSGSSEESHIDPEKPPLVLGEDRNIHHLYDDNARSPGIGAEAGTLPKRTPTLSETRPRARRPPQLNMNAVRDAQARGSLTSLTDLIRRATKLATNLEHGRTASRNDLLNGGGPKFPFQGNQDRGSGSLKDILASFPNPAATSEGHSSWPVFWRRSTLQQLNSQERGQEWGQGNEKARPRRRCCGMPLWAFIVVCVVILLVIAAAVLLPVFLVVVPRENSSGDNGSMCEKTTPCSNGGVSVSSGDVCSCVCINGYTGSHCTVAGDASCVTTEIAQGSTSRNATMGDELPRLFQASLDNFSIPLDPITIMALFSQNDVSCTTENALVSFKGPSSNSNERRSETLDSSSTDQLQSDDTGSSPASVTSIVPTATLGAEENIGAKNGILFAAGEPTATPTTKANPKSTPKSEITPEVLDFSGIAVLYILQKTGFLNAAMYSANSIQTHLTTSYSNSTGENFSIDLIPSGVTGNITLDFNDFSITDFNGETVGA
ncbi:hypothetical protein BJX61DRAFT_540582 [Aspergillus egyptiacus]|nr:hypothetical protein BJX61DRAFT_540582 [Aspergillus egyptiacus]